MATKTITQLTAATALDSDDVFVVDEDGVTKKATSQQVADVVGPLHSHGVGLNAHYAGTRPLWSLPPGNAVLPIANNVVFTANRIYLWPLWVGQDITVDSIFWFVRTAASAGKVMKVAIYGTDSNYMASGTPLYSGTDVACDATGQKKVTGLSVALAAGTYFLALWSDGTPATTGFQVGGSGWPGMQDWNTEFIYQGYLHDTTYGTWPSSTPVTETNIVSMGHSVFLQWTVD